jgi:hypothetical protein
VRRPRGVTAAALALLLAGCQSQWIQQGEHSEVVRTELLVRTEPTGAMVSLNRTKMDVAPVRIPIEYEHVTEQWFRQSNYGEHLRDSTGVVGTILLFPIWLPASLFHGKQEMKRHVYASNLHTVKAQLDGYYPAEQQVELKGEEQVDVLLALTPR